ncbi:MAG: hypothetical protein DI585_05190 [Pseudomonas fluorescens]|nr:MAG: hypothetical protein DI585_05190 [Pseudomonas fluorescens]
MINKFMMPAVALAMTVLLSACGEGKMLSMGKNLPDETRVVDGPTLALPPQFELRPPRESADYESVLRAQKTAEARSLITNGTVAAASTSAHGELEPAAGPVPASDNWLLQKTADQAGVTTDANVRTALAESKVAAETTPAKKGLFARWFGGSDSAE